MEMAQLATIMLAGRCCNSDYSDSSSASYYDCCYYDYDYDYSHSHSCSCCCCHRWLCRQPRPQLLLRLRLLELLE